MEHSLDGRFTFDGKRIPFHDGDTIGSALHRAGVRTISRSMKYHRPRGLYCCTGSCASCLVDVDGVPNLPACTTMPEPGTRVRSQNRIGSAKRDLLAVTDVAFPDGFDPHGAFTRPRLLNNIFLRAVRFMSGWGRAPKTAPAPGDSPPVRRTRHVDELIVGAGAAGLARAKAATGEVLLIDERRTPIDAPDGVEAWNEALAFGIYGDVVAVRRGQDLVEVNADRVTLATGVHDDWPLFPGNDRPGILSLRGARTLMDDHGVLPGRRIVGHGSRLPEDLVGALKAAGADVVAQGTVEEAVGSPVRRAKVDGVWHDCDTIICHLPGVPRIELFQQAGCELNWRDGAIRPVLDVDGRTTVDGIYGGNA